MATTKFKKYGFIKNKKQQAGILKALQGIRDILKIEANWIQGEYRYDDSSIDAGDEVDHFRYCLIGAKQEVDGPYEDDVVRALLTALPKDTVPDEEIQSLIADAEDTEVINYNDASYTSHKDVIRLIDRARKGVAAAR